MRLFRFGIFCSIIAVIVVSLSSCKKNQLLTSGGQLRFSADTLLFDTVFTSLGSATYKIKIYNPQNQKVMVSSVRLQNGNSSPFKLNVNGISGNNVANQEMAAHDSMYVFAIVTIDPNSSTSPFVVEDKLIATLNGNDYSVPVIAYGQNANYIFDSTLKTQTWTSKLPYVIINNALVDTGATLTINKGCRIYVHANSRLFVAGNLQINGTKTDSVIFQSDRIDRSYFSYLDLPGEWGGLYFTSNSKNSQLTWTVIKNCGNSTTLNDQTVQPAAIQVDNNPLVPDASQLKINNCIIQNSIGYGILSFGGGITMRNSMINTCGSQTVGVFQGGNYAFDNCTFVCYGTAYVAHSQYPVMSLLNYLDTSQTGFIPANLNATLNNCIIYGTLNDELICLQKGGIGWVYNVAFNNCLIKASSAFTVGTFNTACIFNTDPKFKDYTKWDYHLADGSPALRSGITLSPGNNLDDVPWTIPYNIGAY